MLKFNEFIKEKYENQFFIETGTSKYELLMIENEVISKIDNLLAANRQSLQGDVDEFFKAKKSSKVFDFLKEM